jgi:glycosyltransferase involved in cell wall biosynthesis
VSVIENGVDVEHFAPSGVTPEPRSLVFTGNMGYEPNVDAVVWFVEHCLPRIREAVPEVKLAIAGARPSRAVQELAREPGVQVTGFVESMPATLNAAEIAVAPLRSASGIQNKILEAMACGLPVVTTTTGLGAIDARDGEHLLVADGEEAHAAAVIRLLGDADLRARLGAAAREQVVARYSWARGAERVEEIYERVLSDRRSSRRP